LIHSFLLDLHPPYLRVNWTSFCAPFSYRVTWVSPTLSHAGAHGYCKFTRLQIRVRLTWAAYVLFNPASGTFIQLRAVSTGSFPLEVYEFSPPSSTRMPFWDTLAAFSSRLKMVAGLRFLDMSLRLITLGGGETVQALPQLSPFPQTISRDRVTVGTPSVHRPCGLFVTWFRQLRKDFILFSPSPLSRLIKGLFDL